MKEKLSSFSLDKLDFSGGGSGGDAGYTAALWGDDINVASAEAGVFDGGFIPVGQR